MKYKDLTLGQVEAILNKLGGMDGAMKFLRDELLIISEPERAWREKNGVIYFTVTSDGTTGTEWVERLKKKGHFIGSDYARSVLLADDFRPTSGITTEVAVLKDMPNEGECNCSNETIRKAAEDLKLETPNAELACLICEKFTNDEIRQMGLRQIVVMHSPINDTNDYPRLLTIISEGRNRFLEVSLGKIRDRQRYEHGFAFTGSQEEKQS